MDRITARTRRRWRTCTSLTPTQAGMPSTACPRTTAGLLPAADVRPGRRPGPGGPRRRLAACHRPHRGAARPGRLAGRARAAAGRAAARGRAGHPPGLARADGDRAPRPAGRRTGSAIARPASTSTGPAAAPAPSPAGSHTAVRVVVLPPSAPGSLEPVPGAVGTFFAHHAGTGPGALPAPPALRRLRGLAAPARSGRRRTPLAPPPVRPDRGHPAAVRPGAARGAPRRVHARGPGHPARATSRALEELARPPA